MNIEELKKLDRESIIELAINQLKERFKSFNPEHFDEIKVMMSETSLYVTFNITFKYVPMKSSYYYGVYINLVESLTSRVPISNPQYHKIKDKVYFFTPTEESKKAVSFVLEAIKSAGEFPEPMIIRDNRKYYEIEIVSEDVAGGYKIEKGSGKLFDDWHDSLVHPPKDEDEEIFTELK